MAKCTIIEDYRLGGTKKSYYVLFWVPVYRYDVEFEITITSEIP